jgi:deazaflavin-dependent oxidoreductase (nitroreductase family)
MITANSKWQLKMERPVIVFFYRVFARWSGKSNILLLATTGRRSQRKRTVPVVYMPVEGGYLVAAANIGLDAHPGWFLNLKHDPRAQIEIGNKKLAVVANEADPASRERLWTDWTTANPGYQGFQAKTTRKIPLVILKPV